MIFLMLLRLVYHLCLFGLFFLIKNIFFLSLMILIFFKLVQKNIHSFLLLFMLFVFNFHNNFRILIVLHLFYLFFGILFHLPHLFHLFRLLFLTFNGFILRLWWHYDGLFAFYFVQNIHLIY